MSSYAPLTFGQAERCTPVLRAAGFKAVADALVNRTPRCIADRLADTARGRKVVLELIETVIEDDDVAYMRAHDKGAK